MLSFRNALVRANYSDWNRGIRRTTYFLELFLRNLLANEKNELKNRHLHIHWDEIKQNIESEKQNIGKQKQDIGNTGQDITIPSELNNKTGKNILMLYSCLGSDQVFVRTQVMEILHITASPA